MMKVCQHFLFPLLKTCLITFRAFCNLGANECLLRVSVLCWSRLWSFQIPWTHSPCPISFCFYFPVSKLCITLMLRHFNYSTHSPLILISLICMICNEVKLNVPQKDFLLVCRCYPNSYSPTGHKQMQNSLQRLVSSVLQMGCQPLAVQQRKQSVQGRGAHTVGENLCQPCIW